MREYFLILLIAMYASMAYSKRFRKVQIHIPMKIYRHLHTRYVFVPRGPKPAADYDYHDAGSPMESREWDDFFYKLARKKRKMTKKSKNQSVFARIKDGFKNGLESGLKESVNAFLNGEVIT